MADCLECILGGFNFDCECECGDFETCNDWYDTIADCDAGDCVDFCLCRGSCYDMFADPEEVPTEVYTSMNSGQATGSGLVSVIPVAVDLVQLAPQDQSGGTS
ncbi:unnamed protein product [Phytophthora fragariaefolia]|uniref:Unnamed protein product n=1 Tax=Phytophthora fragariaefolia TaxID=1490495 RepID=A0A9W6Y8W0_9STRA|nr:unnamed protein product [Phytophthora fragariaefolia]